MYDHHLYFGLQIILFHMIYSLLFNHNFELRSNSLTFGNVIELSFLSLNHDFFTIHDVQTLCDLSLRY